MSAFDAVMRGLQGGSDLKMDVMKKDPASGMLINASDREVNSIGTKASIATNAQLLKNLPPHEKFEWAIEVKEYANGLYAKGDYEQAMIKYAECLAATDFGTTPTPCAAIQKQVVIEDSTTSDVDDDKHRNDTGTGISPDTVECSFGSSSNVDSVVIPVLCNLAACAIQLKQWPKAVQLCQQAIQLRPDCVKALYRQGLALVQAGEFERAMLCLEESSRLLHLEALTDGDTGIDKDGDGDGKGRDKDIDNVRDEDKDKDIDIDKNWGRVVINSDNDNDQHHKAGAAGALLAKEVSKSNSDSLITSSAPNATTAPTPTFL
jgi:tetratricopeptide (TPR) repeat protein